MSQKVSKAARELAMAIMRDDKAFYVSNGTWRLCPDEAARVIQDALDGLLRAAQGVVDTIEPKFRHSIEGELKASLESWRVTT